ncbi:hypothetical protein FRC14_006637 [Serendipita sp. 396]|nr:hypothetical protein FRC14_006637 [Serendipita sp. 396]KAG8797025.1 hypothetical protein FRC18_009087 [Serendipita sp. 400]
MSSIAPTATPTIRKRGPPAPLNLAPQPFPKSQTIIATSNCEDSAVPEPLPVPQPDEQGATSSAPRPALHEQQKPAGSRNVKRLSLSITGSIPPQPAAAPSVAPSSSSQPTGLQPQPPRRHSVASLPGASASTILRRNDEGDTDASAYLDGPIEVMPGIWLGSEDNARDWSTLVKRGIRSILNVAKEVTISFDSPAANQPRRNVTSVPNLHAQVRNNGTYQPAHLPSGRPAMHYLKLSWSHGQPDLVRSGFAEGMAFVDQALARKEGVLVQYVEQPHCLSTFCSLTSFDFLAVNVACPDRPPW